MDDPTPSRDAIVVDHLPQPAYRPPDPVETVRDLDGLTAWFRGDGTMRYDHTVDANRHDNTARAGAASEALLAFASRTGQRSENRLWCWVTCLPGSCTCATRSVWTLLG
ncbi:hypothetical protein [Amycolatopsis sp. CA-230715]|uniref:hypothetical protein n=1 Tax=Amycolatopsis sp. CA-230715 TaxID=2745196 RepID=UPI001C01674B|nr:hypothetical protein [Amycolatopsis sp. CA-230715]QWF85685.1 hypothetical protein HUW46_09165 [Amycolatopsis sp. CA-230715]